MANTVYIEQLTSVRLDANQERSTLAAQLQQGRLRAKKVSLTDLVDQELEKLVGTETAFVPQLIFPLVLEASNLSPGGVHTGPPHPGFYFSFCMICLPSYCELFLTASPRLLVVHEPKTRLLRWCRLESSEATEAERQLLRPNRHELSSIMVVPAGS